MYAANRAPAEKVEDVTIPARIDTLLTNGMVNDWETNFLISIKGGYEKYKSLTKGQYDTFVKVEQRYDSAAIASRSAWTSTWDAEKAGNWKAMMDYYITTPYYKGATDKYKKDPKYIPSEKEYKAICDNKYAVRYLKNRVIPAKFRDGQLVVYKRYGNYFLSTIVSTGEVSDWSKGSRRYTILPIGEASPLTVLEKELLYYREGLIPKIRQPDDDVPF